MIAAPILSLSGSGWLLPFHIGVVDALRARSLMPPRGHAIPGRGVRNLELAAYTRMSGTRQGARSLEARMGG